MMRTDILDRKQSIVEWISQKQSKAFICRMLKCKPSTLDSYLKKMNINYIGNRGLEGRKTDPKYLTAKEYIKNTHVSAHKLKLKMIRDGLKEHRCEICGITEWMGKKAPIELDHIDGNHFNNDLRNLRILCPNCHAQTETNSGKTVKNKNAPVVERQTRMA